MAYNPYRTNGYSMPCFNINNDLFLSKVEAIRSTRARNQSQNVLDKKFTELKSRYDETAKLQQKRLGEAISLIEAQQNEIEALQTRVGSTSVSNPQRQNNDVRQATVTSDRDTFNRRVVRMVPRTCETQPSKLLSDSQQIPGRSIEFANNEDNDHFYTSSDDQCVTDKEHHRKKISNKRKGQRVSSPPKAKKRFDGENSHQKGRPLHDNNFYESYSTDEDSDYTDGEYTSTDEDYETNGSVYKESSDDSAETEVEKHSDPSYETSKQQFERTIVNSKPSNRNHKLKSIIKKVPSSQTNKRY